MPPDIHLSHILMSWQQLITAQRVRLTKAEDVIARLDGTLCGFRNTSCPDQIAQNLKKALEEMN